MAEFVGPHTISHLLSSIMAAFPASRFPATDDERIQMMAARIETLQSEVESLRKDVDERDIVAILLDNAIKIGLLRTDHIQ